MQAHAGSFVNLPVITKGKLLDRDKSKLALYNRVHETDTWLRVARMRYPLHTAEASRTIRAEFYDPENPDDVCQYTLRHTLSLTDEFEKRVKYGIQVKIAEYRDGAAKFGGVDFAHEYKFIYIVGDDGTRHALFANSRPISAPSTDVMLRILSDSPELERDITLAELDAQIQAATQSSSTLATITASEIQQSLVSGDGNWNGALHCMKLLQSSSYLIMRHISPFDRVFSIKELCELPNTARAHLYNVLCAMHAGLACEAEAKDVIALAFPWLHDAKTLPAISPTDVGIVLRHSLGPKTMVRQRFWKKTLAWMNFVYCAFQAARTRGHALIVDDDMIHMYCMFLRDKRNVSRTLATISPDVGEMQNAHKKRGQKFIHDNWKSMMNAAVGCEVVHAAKEYWIMDKNYPRVASVPPSLPPPVGVVAEPKIVYYTGEDWAMQQYVAAFFMHLMTVRWKAYLARPDTVYPNMTDLKLAAALKKLIYENKSGRLKLSARPPRGQPWVKNKVFLTIYERCDPQQKRFIRNMIRHPLAIATGMPGCGKTDLILAARELFPDMISMAAYGRIASLHEERFQEFDKKHGREVASAVCSSMTVHRAAAICKYRDGTPQADAIEQSTLKFYDEFPLLRTSHLYMSAAFSTWTLRVVMVGDMNQKGAIGHGGIGPSMLNRFGRDPEYHVRLRIPHRFIGKNAPPEAHQRFDFGPKRPEPHEPLAMAWNMRILSNQDLPAVAEASRGSERYYEKSDWLRDNLIYSTDIDSDARFVLLPLRANMIDTYRPIVEKYRINGTTEIDIQLVSHRNETCRKVGRVIRHLLFTPNQPFYDGPSRSKRVFAVNERIVFAKNKYMSKDMENADELERATLGELDNVQFDQGGYTTSSVATVVGGKRSREEQPAPKPARTEKWRGTDSDDVANGNIRTIRTIAYVNGAGKVVGRVQTTDSNEVSGDPRFTGSRALLIFTDDKQLFLDDYDMQNMEYAYCINSARFQGSECRVVGNITDARVPEAVNLFEDRENQFTSVTRGQERTIAIMGSNEINGIRIMQAIIDKPAPPILSSFANYIVLE